MPINDSIQEDAHGKIKGHQKRCQEEASQISKGKEKGEAGKEEREIVFLSVDSTKVVIFDTR
jgi:hypothetical protein